jgi:GNAT superfamily N-acetyltransferase
MHRKIPSNFSFGLCSDAKKSDELRYFLNEFSSQFKCSRVNKRKGWKKRISEVFETEEGVSRRDALICYNSRPAGIQQFSVASKGIEAYAEGIYVRENCRGEGVGIFLREVLFSYLMQEGVKKFYIGSRGPQSTKVLKTKQAQRLAEKDISLHRKAVIDLRRTEKRRFVSSYGFDFSRYDFVYDASKIRIR